MLPCLGTMAIVASFLTEFGPETASSSSIPGSYLTTYTRTSAGVHQVHVEPYYPRPGDLILYNDHKLYWKILYNLAGTEPPDHSGIIILKKDGKQAILESGPDNGRFVEILDALPRLTQFEGTAYIRRLKDPLPKDQCAKLTEFAYAQEGKRYATGRLILQMTPFRCRGSWRRKYFGGTVLDRDAWLCSELVVAAGTIAGLFDHKVHPANAMYPRDIIFDETYDLSSTWHVAGVWSPAPPKILSADP